MSGDMVLMILGGIVLGFIGFICLATYGASKLDEKFNGKQ